MKKEYLDTPFGNLINSYAYRTELDDDLVEKALRAHAQKWGGCVSCRYSICHPMADTYSGNIWLLRSCQLGLNQNECTMHERFPD